MLIDAWPKGQKEVIVVEDSAVLLGNEKLIEV
jgi:hypothetical protein